MKKVYFCYVQQVSQARIYEECICKMALSFSIMQTIPGAEGKKDFMLLPDHSATKLRI